MSASRPALPPGPWRPYTQMRTASPPLEVAWAKGSRIGLADGRELVDGIASWWTACHGANPPSIAAAVSDQLEHLPHIMFGGLTHAPAERLARRLAALLPGSLDHVFFSDSGSVAVEVALKMALQLWRNRGVAGRSRFLAFRDGYHGDTLGAMSVCDPVDSLHAHFGAGLLPQVFAALPHDAETAEALERTLAAHARELAAVIVEPRVQGAGGMRFHSPETLRRVAEAARRHGLPLILDEVFTGFGRTGAMFACETAGVVPDICCLSKALTGGVTPLAATVASEEVFAAFWSDDPADALMHGPTFMAHALGCAAANASLDLFEAEPRLEQIAALEGALEAGLDPCRGGPGVVDVRVVGAIGVVQLARPPDREAMKRAFLDRGVWVRPFGDIVYLTPAFTIGADDLGRLTQAVVEVVSTLA